MPADTDSLYALPLEAFTKARDELARNRRAADDPQGAAVIKALRKPSVPAWALNQTARARPELVGALLAEGRRVRAASDRALAGDASEFRDASRALAARAAALADAAAALLAGAGRPPAPATYDRIMTTARAAATDDELGTRLQGGTLTDDVAAAGFGLEGLTVPDAAPAPTPETDGAAARAAAREHERLQADIERTSQRLERAAREIDELESRLAAARERVESAERELRDLRAREAGLNDS